MSKNESPHPRFATRWFLDFALCLLVLLLAVGFTVREEAVAATHKHAIAVIIGNKNYVCEVPDDATAIKRYVIDVLGYRDGNIIDPRDAGFVRSLCPL